MFAPESCQISSKSQAYSSCPAHFSHSKPYECPAERELNPGLGNPPQVGAIELTPFPTLRQRRHTQRERLQQSLPGISGLSPSGRIPGCRALLLLLTQRSSPRPGQPRGACPATASRRENDCGTMAGTASLGQLCHINCQQ